ncbi:MAG TPA: tripartite tricarboxylate transporter substrate-binding protein [Candidatus Binatia bacterium]|nr:tripartite tricarboxylate transporter substrate-binding protein [Candidatus Binatia bacterium]
MRLQNSWMVGLAFALITTANLGAEGARAAEDRRERFEILVPSPPGGSRDVYARLIARQIGKYLPGNPTVIVKNMPGAGGDIMLNFLYHRAKQDGSVFATGTNAMYRAQRLGLKSAQYDLRKFNFIGAMPESPYLLVIRNDHPVKLYQELLTTKEPVYYGMERPFGGGSTELVGNALKDALGAQLSFVTGYKGSALRVNAILRKEIDTTLDRLSTAEDFLKEKQLRILLILTHADRVPAELRGDAPEWFKLDLTPEVRELSDFVVTPTDLDKSYLAPPDVPAERVQNLRDAFEKVLAEPGVQKFLKERVAVSPSVTGEDLQKKVVPRLLGVSEATVTKVKAWFEETK